MSSSPQTGSPARAQSTAWVAGVVVDEHPPPKNPGALLLALALALLVIEAVLTLGRPARDADGGSADAVRAVLAEAAQHDGDAWLLIGDSVLAGDVAAGRDASWQTQRVIDHLRVGVAADSNVAFRQLAFDGLLPTDAERFVAELDRLDPAHEVQLLIELNPRYFSAQYAEQWSCTRPAFCELGPHGVWAGLKADARAAARRWLPIFRHRDGVGFADDASQLLRTGARGMADTLSRDEAQARMREHYRSAEITPEHAQVQALRRLVAGLDESGRRAVFFSTPLEDGFVDTAKSPRELGRYYGRVAGLIHELESPNVELVELDHPVFVSELFIDHCHLWKEGNRLLAENLSHELGLARDQVVQPSRLAHQLGPDQSLVHRRTRGFADGPAWMALFDRPDGVAVSPDGARVVVADTGNHLLRELRGNFQTVETLAGVRGKPGDRDGERQSEARIQDPRAPVFVGARLYFIDGADDAARVRVIEGDATRTLSALGQPCREPERLKSDGEWLYVACGDGRIVRVGPDDAVEVVLDVGAAGGREVVAFTPSPDGLYVADPDNRIWRYPAGGKEPELVFANSGNRIFPKGKELRATFPMDFSDVAFLGIQDLLWAERYGGLLVLDEAPAGGKNAKRAQRVTARMHLRFLDLDGRRVYAWIKPLVHGDAYSTWSDPADTPTSVFHLGSMALDQRNASILYLERERSRLFRLEDGLLGAAKTGNLRSQHWVHLRNPFGNRSGEEAFWRFRPDRYLDDRPENERLRGPFIGLMVGSSLTAVTDHLGNYSLGRRLERELALRLEQRDRVGFDLFQRVDSAATLRDVVEHVRRFVDASGRADVIFIEMQSFSGRFLKKTEEDSEIVARLQTLVELAAASEALLILFDDSSLTSRYRDGLRPPPRDVRRVTATARAMGILVIDPGDQLLRELLTDAPWGNQPWARTFHHGTPWAIDLTAEALAEAIYPSLRARFRDRTPARLRTDLRRPKSGSGRAALAAVMDELDVQSEDLPRVPTQFLQARLEDRTLHVIVDIAGVPELAEHPTSTELIAVSQSAVLDALSDGPFAMLAERVALKIVRFRSYDEYGDGALDAADVLVDVQYDASSLEALFADE